MDIEPFADFRPSRLASLDRFHVSALFCSRRISEVLTLCALNLDLFDDVGYRPYDTYLPI